MWKRLRDRIKRRLVKTIPELSECKVDVMYRNGVMSYIVIRGAHDPNVIDNMCLFTSISVGTKKKYITRHFKGDDTITIAAEDGEFEVHHLTYILSELEWFYHPWVVYRDV